MKFISTLEECKNKQIKLVVKNNKLLISDECGNLTEELTSQLREYKQDIIAWFNPENGNQQALEPAPALEHYPLSYSQQRLWFIDQLEQNSTQYHLSYALRVKGALNVEAMKYALNALVARHQVLRTVFVEHESEPVQIVQQEVSVPVVVERLDAHQSTMFKEVIQQETQRPFDLRTDVMLRCKVLELHDQQKIVIFTMHHIASDGWSMGIFVNEFSELYQAHSQNRHVELAPLPIQFKDFAYWQRHGNADATLQTDLAYWLEKLAGIPQVHSLALDKPRPAKQSYEAKRLHRMLDSTVYQSLMSLANQHDATLFMVMQAAFSALLAYQSGSEDIVMGVPHAGREHQATKGLIGFFINTLVLRTSVSSEMTVSELIKQAKETVLEAFSHDKLPFEQLIESLNPQRTLAYNPVCQIKFVLQNHEMSSLDLPEVDFTPIEKEGDQVRFDLDLTAKASENGIYLGWSYKEDLFSGARMERMADCFEALLREMANHSDAKVSDLGLLNEHDTAQLIDWGQGEIAHANRVVPLIRQIEQQADKTPNAEAVCYLDNDHNPTTLSYGALNDKAGKLASVLDEAGVESGDHVGVYLTRSIELLIALLAVQKIGAVYVVLGANQGTQRLSEIIEDASIEVVLQDRTQNLPALPGVDAIFLDGAATHAQWLSEYQALAKDVALADIAYVLYTSGSTGKPKGVQVTHEGLLDYCQLSSSHHYPGNGSLVATAPTFDLTIPGLYVPLINGGSVCLISEDDPLTQLASALQNDALEQRFVRLTPSHLRAVLPLLQDRGSAKAHVFVIGGEKLSASIACELQQRFPKSQIYNHYGPTETVVGASSFDVTEFLRSADTLENIGSLPIGKALPNTCLYVLTEAGNLSSIGVPGELCIATKRMAKGYLNHADLSAEKFVRLPALGNEQVYRTGDKVRWLESGQLDFLGRMDEQVKIRGYRVELGDIEHQLTRHEAVSEAVVKVWGEDEESQLAAYVVANSQVESDSLHAFLRERLPEYMLPQSIELIDSMPLSANGKVNKNALLAPLQQEVDQSPPQNDTERLLAKIWSNILGIKDIGRFADFFALGGHSLKATRAVSEISQAFSKPVPVRALFENRILATLAQYIDGFETVECNQIQCQPRTEPLPLSFAQQRLWFIDQLEGASPQYNMSSALKIKGALDVAAMRAALQGLVKRHEILRTVYVQIDDEPKQQVCADAKIKVLQHDLSAQSGEAQQQAINTLVNEQASCVFDLAEDLMIKACLVRLSEVEHVLIFTVHHIASDGWSNAIIGKELTALYQAAVSGTDAELAPLSIQYADYAVWQRQRLGDAGLEGQLNYWKTQLAGMPQVHSLPLDKPRLVQQDFAGEQLVQIFDEQQATKLKAFCKAQGVTLFAFVQTLLSLLMARYSGEKDIVIGAPTAGRQTKQVEPLIGFFLNTLVLRTQFVGNPSFMSQLKQNQQMILDAFSNDTIPFDMLVDELKPVRSLSYHPVVQVMLNVFEKEAPAQPQRDQTELTIEPLHQDDKVQLAKADLTVYVRHMGDKLFFNWSYRTALFEPHSIEQLTESFAYLLDEALANPSSGIFDLPISAQQDTCTHYPQGRTIETPSNIVDQIWAHGQTDSESIALQDGHTALTYKQLCEQAECLALDLMDEGVKPGDHIAVLMTRRCEWVIAALATLRVGAVYVPISTEFPDERVAYILADVDARIVLTEDTLIARLPESSHSLMVEMSTGVPLIQDVQWPVISPEAPAHIIYTSGTTGNPKGVVGSHKSLSNRINWMLDEFAFSHDEVTAVVTSSAFIRSVWEMFTPLVAGTQSVLISNDVVLDQNRLVETLAAHGVTRIVTAPSLARAVSAVEGVGTALQAMRYWFLSGEPLQGQLANNLKRLLASTQIVNLYGSTETMSDVSFYVVQEDIQSASAPIGKAIANNTVLIVNNGQIQPSGVPGEICVTGVNLALSYWGQQTLTAEKFVTLENGQRAYRTGDLGRLLPSQDIECLGRADNQVKIRGFRIELGEIESMLVRCAQIETAVVLALGEGDARYLAAYIVLTSGNTERTSLDDIRLFIKQWLPEYMLPKLYAVLDVLPLTANGKVNRRALSQIEIEHHATQKEPSTSTEILVAKVWQGILGVSHINASDNFFEIGGHSLLATRVVNQVNKRLSKHISVRAAFEHPTLSELAAYIDSSNTDEQSKPIEKLAKKEAPLSYAQQRLWFVNELDGAGADYNQSIVLRFKGKLNLRTVEKSISAIVNRHEILRSVYNDEGERVIQRVLQDVTIKPEFIDLYDLGEDEQEIALKQKAKQELKYAFDLRHEPSLRYAIAHCGDDDFVMFVTVHHIATDGWSKGILSHEFIAFYSALITGEDVNLPPLPIQYSDYAQWQIDARGGDVLQLEWDYWQQQLKDLPVTHGLPLDRARPNQQDYRAQRHSQLIAPALADKLDGFAKSHQVSLFILMQAALATLISRWSNEQDIVLGTPIAGRNRAEVEPLVGFFVNNLVLRNQVDGTQSFSTFLNQSKKMVVDAFANQHTPFDSLVERLNPERHLSHAPLFQIALAMQNNAAPALSLPDVEVSTYGKDVTSVDVDMHINVSVSDDGIHLRWLYATAIFDERTVASFADSFATLLNSIVTDTQLPISRLNIMPHDDLSVINRHSGNWPVAALDELQLAHERVEYWAQLQPNALAVSCDEDTLSYCELNRTANQLAAFFRAQGLKSGTLVAVCVERTVEMSIAILAVLKAGGAYLPIDPEYPEDRIVTMLEEADVEWVISQNSVIESLSCLADYQTFPMDKDIRNALLAAMSEENIAKCETGIESDSAAYCIFTSGSTGTPKGVLLTHGGLANLQRNQQKLYHVESTSRVMAFASLSFDGATFEWLWALANGASLHICNQEQRLSARHLAQFLLDNDITHAAIPPAILTHMSVDKAYSLEALIVAGEACEQSLAWRWAQKCHVYNSYGPSESTVAVTHAQIYQGEPITLGSALDNVVVDVVNNAGEIQPVGVSGEIRIGGASLAKGYLDAGLTSERFVQHQDGHRYYYTGDLGKRNAEGVLEFIGRKDSQVKIRGFRIELGEIEQQLVNHTHISKAVVLVDESSGTKQLIAYVTLTNSLDIAESEAVRQWREYLKQQLPHYMIPASFMVVENFALTSNGKVDKRKLPAPIYQSVSQFVAPQSETEIELAQLWGTLLGVENISAHADFFELGGHSLLATQMMSHLAQSLNKEIPIRAIFEHTSLQAFARYVDTLECVQFSAIPVVDRALRIPLSFSQQRLWFIYQLEGASAQYNMQVALKFSRGFDVEVLQRVLNTLQQRHEILRTTYANEGGEGVQIIHPHGTAVLSHIDLSTDSESADAQLLSIVQDEMKKPFDLTQDSALRCTVVKLPSDESALILSTHHIASDGWSMNVLAKEFMSLYKSHSARSPVLLSPLNIQYADYAHWQRNVLGDEAIQNDLSYWKTQLSGLPAVHGLPLDKSRPARQQFNGAHIVRVLAPERVAKLHALANTHDASLFMLLQSLLKVVYAHFSGESDIVLGTPVAGRQHKDLEPLIGFFVNSLVLRSDVSKNPTFTELLAQVKQTTLDAFAHQSLPFEALVEELKPERSLAYSPLYQLSLTYHNHEMTDVELDAVSVSRIDRQTQQSRYDLEVHMRENDEGLYVRWVYATSLFNPQTIERIAQSFEMAIDTFTQNPHQTIRGANLTPVEDLERIARWNKYTPSDSAQLMAHQAVEQWAESTPDAIAVACESQSMSYGELNAAANQLARYLIDEGVSPDSIIGICVNRSVEMLIGVLGVLKAGGAYLPMDPNYPEQRLIEMVEDSHIDIVLTQAEVLEVLPFLSEQTVLPLDREFREVLFAEYNADNIPVSEVSLTPQNLAYMVYTSGSTGKPKGVMLTHQGVSNLMFEQQLSFEVKQQSQVLQFSSFSFDAATWDWLLALTNGATLHLCDQETRLSATDLAVYLAANKITHALIPPAMLAQLPVTGDYALEVLVVGGEACDPELAWAWAQQCRVVNAYGPSESTVVATFSDVVPQQPITLGRATANNFVHVVNEAHMPVPVGVPGELLIGGASLAQGYWQRADLTQSKFVTTADGLRMYCTGDVVRWLSTGELEYLGRADDQVKIRGFRVELGEVENRLKLQSKVANAVVTVHHSSAQQRLVAYVVPVSTVDLTTIDKAEFIAQLRGDIRDVLPEFMVPSVFMLLPNIPITANGKVDKQNLPEPEFQADSSYIAPATEWEQKLVELVAEILELNVAAISITANFFDLGGHSVLAIKLVSNINQLYGIDISIRHLFLYNTLGALAEYIEQGSMKQAEQWQSLTLINNTPSSDLELLCVPAAGLLPMSYQALGNALDNTVSLSVFEPCGLQADQKRHTRLEQIVSSYLDEILANGYRDSYVLSGHSFGGAVAFELAVALEKLGKSVTLILLDSLIYLPDAVREARHADDVVQQMAIAMMNDEVSRTQTSGTEREGVRSYEEQVTTQALQQHSNNGDFIHSLQALMKTQFEIYKSYQPRCLFGGQTILIRAQQGVLAHGTYSEIQAHLSCCLSTPAEILDVPGSHMSMLSTQYADVLASELTNILVTLEDANQVKKK
ncbi:amino acid adenylation domain-containing protein [Pseudoalteromonas sp. SMS1]|uniref:non-ribosomal peptide synthetase n=1 Tax=Pseudoalteromonas sp. SMS1 TaxID=2908894 RepID=UPI001F2B9B11|nr:non-ribosomal peptide synthetase [Pseudoalteromonas sp. SMS1]MCF2856182.1 amino acid adenylation domain-containing protein [Pseudoalteromonas sp. SMS1]